MKQIKGITLRDNKWQVRTTYKGQKIYRLFSTGTQAGRTLAEKYLQGEKNRIDAGQYYEGHKTLEEIYLFMDEEKKGDGVKKEQTSITTDYYFYNHIADLLNKDRYIDTFTDYDILQFRDKLKDRGLAPSTQGNVIELLKQIYRTAIKHKWAHDDYAALINKPRVASKDVKTFTDREVELLYKQAEKDFSRNPNILGMLVLGLYGGLRVSEMRGLQWKDIDFENHCIHVTKQYHLKLQEYTGTKTKGSVRDLEVLPKYEAMLKRIYDRASKQEGFKDTDSVLTSWHGRYKGKPLGYTCFREMLGRLAVRCGLPKESKTHVLRKTCGTNLIEKQDLSDACAWLGHTKADTTWKYYANKDSTRKSAYNKMYQDYLQESILNTVPVGDTPKAYVTETKGGIL